jgi:MFS superfamily sulfate permease-like transporter
MVLSLLQHVRHGYRPNTAIVIHDPVEHWRLQPLKPVQMIEPGVVLYWFGADLYYANTNHFVEEVQCLASKPGEVRWIVIDAESITSIDYSAGRALIELHRDLAAKGVTLVLTRVNDRLRAELDRQEVTLALGAGSIFTSRKRSLAAFRAACGVIPEAVRSP